MVVMRSDRRRISIINVILQGVFIVALIILAFWIGTVDAKTRNMATLQKVVIETNTDLSKQFGYIRQELKNINLRLQGHTASHTHGK